MIDLLGKTLAAVSDYGGKQGFLASNLAVSFRGLDNKQLLNDIFIAVVMRDETAMSYIKSLVD